MNQRRFLSHLLTTQNSLKASSSSSGDDQECPICKEDYGACPPSELQIRLPCNPKHTVGSHCIATWLKEHNSCPIYRCEFFPAEKNSPRADVIEDLYVDLGSDDDELSDRGDDPDDEDFRYDDGDVNYEDENMSDDEGSASEEEDEDMSGGEDSR